MRATIYLGFLVVFYVGLAIKADCYETNIVISVTADEKNLPQKITIEEVKTSDPPVELKMITDRVKCYQTEVCPDCKTTENQRRLKVDYLLVAVWGDGQEQVSLALGPSSPKKIVIPIYRESLSPYDPATLKKIKELPWDKISMWKKYFQARMFYRKWRSDDKDLPIAIESARIWFDAVVKLALLRNSCIRVDEELDNYLQEYEKQAKEDKRFERRYRRYFEEGEYQRIKEQLIAKRYEPVGEVPKLLAKGEIENAKALNETALAALSKESEEVQKIVLSLQGVNKELLVKNAKFLDGKMMALDARMKARSPEASK